MRNDGGAERRDPIVAPSFVVSGRASFHDLGDQALLNHARDGTIECTSAESELAARPRFDILNDGVTVSLAVDQRQQEMERHGRKREKLAGVQI